jgi:D-3-phosphoglycerate dehydrogenase / 2-oxoglutarate reductase
MKVLVADQMAEEGIANLREEGIEVDVKVELSPAELAEVIPEYSGLLVRSATKVTAEIFEAAEKLKIVGRAGTGVDNIDLQAATKHGVLVVNAPGGNSVSAAEMAFGLMLACARNIPRGDRNLKNGVWAKKECKGRELVSKTLGIIGLGRIGREVAVRAKAFGMRVVGYDPMVDAATVAKMGVEGLDFDELLKSSHFITLHVPRTKETTNMIGAAQFSMMRDDAILINAARGGLVDEKALLAALDDGQLAGAGLDVYVDEPKPPAELVAHDKIVATPHLGASTYEAQVKVATFVAGYLADFLLRGKVQSAVNKPNIGA